MKKDKLIPLLYKYKYSSVYLSQDNIGWVDEPEYLEDTEEYGIIKNRQEGEKYSLVIHLKSNENIIDEELLEHLAKIQITSLHISAGLRSLPSNIGNLQNLIDLDLSGNKLDALPSETGQLTKLKSLYLIENDITGLPSEIGQLTNLTNLCLINNLLVNLPPEIGNLTQLKELDLQGNSLRTLPSEIWQLHQLETLILSYNSLRSLSPKIKLLSQIKHLYIDNNYLQKLPAEIWLLSQLTDLDISCNKLSSLPTGIEKLANLETLNISNRDVNDDLIGKNQIAYLPVELLNLPKLKTLDLRDNPLSIPPEILAKVEEPQTILNYYLSIGPGISPEFRDEIFTHLKPFSSKHLNEISLPYKRE